MKEYWINVYKSEYCSIWYGTPRESKHLAKVIADKRYIIYRIHVKMK